VYSIIYKSIKNITIYVLKILYICRQTAIIVAELLKLQYAKFIQSINIYIYLYINWNKWILLHNKYKLFNLVFSSNDQPCLR